MSQSSSADAASAAIIALETQRCELISQDDIDGLGELLTDDYIHVHITGRVDEKAGALKAFERAPRTCSRGELRVRVYGDVAVVTGPQSNLMKRGDGSLEEIGMMVTTVVRRSADGWRVASFHGCRQG